MSRPTFSIVIPTHNYAHFLGLTLESVFQQDRTDVEVIVVDDASTDHTPQVVERYPVARYVRLDRNVGPGRAWSIGMEHAHGRYVAKLDADDWQLPGWFEAMQTAFEGDPRIGLVAGSVILYRDDRELLREPVTTTRQVLSSDELREQLLRQFFFRMPAVCLRSEMLAGHSRPRSELRLPHDWEYFLRATRGWKAALLPDVVAVYRIHTGSLTVTSESENRLLNDYRRLLDVITDPDDPAHLEGEERSTAIAAMARGYLGSVGPRLSLREPRAAYRHVATAFDIARWDGARAVTRTGLYLAYGVWRRLAQVLRRDRSEQELDELLPRGFMTASESTTPNE